MLGGVRGSGVRELSVPFGWPHWVGCWEVLFSQGLWRRWGVVRLLKSFGRVVWLFRLAKVGTSHGWLETLPGSVRVKGTLLLVCGLGYALLSCRCRFFFGGLEGEGWG